MDTLRIALILGGLLLLVIIIIWDRARRRAAEQRRRTDQEQAEMEGASGADTTDDLLDGEWSVGPVRVSKGVDEAIDAVTAMGGLSSARQEDSETLFGDAPSDSFAAATPSESAPEPLAEPITKPPLEALSSEPESEARHTSEAEPATAEEPVKPSAEESSGDDGNEHVLILTLLATEGERLHGPALLRAVTAQGMELGEGGLFHRCIDDQPLYSMANILEPGHFDANKIDRLATPGVMLFLQLPGPLGAERAVDEFFDTARVLADTLDATLANQMRQPIDEAGLNLMREKLLG